MCLNNIHNLAKIRYLYVEFSHHLSEGHKEWYLCSHYGCIQNFANESLNGYTDLLT